MIPLVITVSIHILPLYIIGALWLIWLCLFLFFPSDLYKIFSYVGFILTSYVLAIYGFIELVIWAVHLLNQVKIVY